MRLRIRTVRPDQPAGGNPRGPLDDRLLGSTDLPAAGAAVDHHAAADKRAEATFHDASATLHEMAHVQGHLAAQDELLTQIAAAIGLSPVPVIDNPALDETADPDPEG